MFRIEINASIMYSAVLAMIVRVWELPYMFLFYKHINNFIDY